MVYTHLIGILSNDLSEHSRNHNTPLPRSDKKSRKSSIEGLQSLTAETVIATSGLKIGEPFQLKHLTRRLSVLVDSGLFKKVGISHRTVGRQRDDYVSA
jgi:outer membrane protein assembly factor BamA